MKRKIIGIGFATLMAVAVIGVSVYSDGSFHTEQINIIRGQRKSVSNLFPCATFNIQDNTDLHVNGECKDKYHIKNPKDIQLYADKIGKYKIEAKMFGAIPVKEVCVNVLPDVRLYPSGRVIGVKLETEGVIAVDFEDIKTPSGKGISPARESGLRCGDVIRKINNIPVNTAKEFRDTLNNITQKKIRLDVQREDARFTFTVQPVFDVNEKNYKIGLWVRDNVEGLGTLTCVTEDKRQFAALGHPITDMDSGITVPIRRGELLEADVVNVVKSRKKDPGEIKGLFTNTDNIFGRIVVNNAYGIFGTYLSRENLFVQESLPIATQDQIKPGKAKIITTLDDGTHMYDIQIEKVHSQTYPDTKSMLIRVTDPVLLKKTGGIIQGMSGSPIIQDGRIVGAVTHVLVNDPERGYAIFIEWMIKDMFNCQD